MINALGLTAFWSLLPEIVRATISSLEQGQDSGVFVDFRNRDSHYECITVAAVKEIIDKVKFIFAKKIYQKRSSAFIICSIFWSSANLNQWWNANVENAAKSSRLVP